MKRTEVGKCNNEFNVTNPFFMTGCPWLYVALVGVFLWAVTWASGWRQCKVDLIARIASCALTVGSTANVGSGDLLLTVAVQGDEAIAVAARSGRFLGLTINCFRSQTEASGWLQRIVYTVVVGSGWVSRSLMSSGVQCYLWYSTDVDKSLGCWTDSMVMNFTCLLCSSLCCWWYL